LHPQNLKGEQTMKRLLMTIALSCALSGTVLAGQIPTVGFTAPPPDETSTPTTPSDIPTVGLSQQMSDAALDLVQLVLGAVV
jgi:hypothetical protein